MRTLATLREPDSGSAMLGDIDVLKQKDLTSVRDFPKLVYTLKRVGIYGRALWRRLRRVLLFCAALNLASTIVFGQKTKPTAVLQVTGEHLAATDTGDRPIVEPTLAIDPADSRHWVVAAIVASPDLSDSDCATMVTLDSGRTWERHDLHVPRCFDPWLAFVGGDEVLLAVLEKASYLRLFRSPDGGKSWLPLPQTASAVDHEMFVYRQSSDANKPDVYIVAEQDMRETISGADASSIMIAQLPNLEEPFRSMNVFPSLLSLNAMNPVVLEDGTLLVPYVDFSRPSPTGDAPLQHGRSWLLRSVDRGQTFAPPSLISESCYRGWEWLSLDNSATSPFRGNLYYVCTGVDYQSVLLHRSMDGGRTWAAPVSVGNSSGRARQRTPMIAVGGHGTVGISWYQDSQESDSSTQTSGCQKLFFSASLDGGATLSNPVKVSSDPSCSSSRKNGEAGRRWPAGGDYIGLHATPDGVFHLVWSDARNGVYELWTADIKETK